MSNPKEIKNRILSIASIIKTTEAMKMISIVKLRKSKESLIHFKKYSKYIEQLFQNILYSFHENTKILKKNNYFFSSKKKLFIVITSNRGLCGSFNSLIFDKINKIIQKKDNSVKNEDIFFSIGKKGFNFFFYQKNILYMNIKKKFLKLIFLDIYFFVKKIIEDFLSQKISSIYLIYNYLKNTLFQEVIVEKILPISLPTFSNQKLSEYEYSILEPSNMVILNYMIPKLISVKIFKSLLESSTSEHTSRMISMHKATENANDIKRNLMLNYNKERQTNITKEILEIISGWEALI
ncbi:ATP synthase F1 subunit gamma [Blattabacterium sp. (Cryptocercus punctulatus) str. Cpu]|uniref:ATP synthase F1 subunit gamma n=1 Tax=Blattabacterium sp. (Cryptocercus punctulatus) str. Cpu TaxID=1075399 RepID=UPI00023871BA|nr:ATP synthase F1 subunit gamma [Blattabacterium sp. (Cryptocercus punctulatus) str. Cpu]AEU09561.1 ATP synthase F1 subunit gamma [Blattabacterium sp. (Cryptocercus punctulatus) str. Cpu]